MTIENEEQVDAFPGMDFPDIGEPEKEEETELSAEAKRLAELEEERKEWQSRYDKLQDTVNTLIAKPEAEPEKVNEPEFLSAELPDPVEKPEDFKKALRDRDEAMRKYVNDLNANALKNYTSQNEETTKLNKMWSDFKTKYEDIDETLAETFARKEAERIRAEGRDPKKVMLSNPDGFMENVATSAKSYLAKFNQPNNRTAVLGGDTATGGKKTPDAPNFIDQIKDFQRKDGFY